MSPGDDETSTTSETQKAQDCQSVPFLRCSPSTSISSSPGASPKATPRPSPMEEKVFVEKGSEEESGSSSAVLSSKASLELFDEEGNPIPPIRRKAGVGSDQEVKLSAESERRKLSQASSWSGYSDGATQDLSPPRTMVTSVTPTTEESGGHPAPALTSPSNMGAFKTFISHIGKKGSSHGLVDKLDGSSFSRSRSSSISSLENITSEAVQCLAFADSYSKKNDNILCPTLWVGTSLGSVIQVMVFLPSPSELRTTTPVNVAPSGTIFRLKGSVLAMSFLDCNGALIPYTYESWKDANREGRKLERTPTKSFVNNRMSPTNSSGEPTFSDRQFMVIASDKLARVVALPSHNCVYKQIITEVSFVVKAEIIQMKDAVCLVCYVATGHISVFSLPSLRQLIYVDFLPLADLRSFISYTLNSYHKPFETTLTVTTFLTQKCLPHALVFRRERQGLLIPCCRFGASKCSLMKTQIIGENSGKASRSVAKHIPGPSSQLESLNIRSSTVAAEVAKTRMQLVERGEKLGQLEDRSAKMMTEAEGFSSTAHNLMLKYKDKKWYQL
ncbi:Syntaxin-binding protein 5 [Armadillidium vulgare]|nr:Syntaxin-binding protein 5 [Armadillidium vulgare]